MSMATIFGGGIAVLFFIIACGIVGYMSFIFFMQLKNFYEQKIKINKTKRCMKCKTENNFNNNFCNICGYKL